MHTEPALWAELTERLAAMAVASLRAQVEAGAQAVQLFDSWAGSLSPDEYARFALPAGAGGARRRGGLGCADHPVRGGHGRAAGADGVGRPLGGGRGLAGAAGRGPPADRPGTRGAGQPRPGAGAGSVAGGRGRGADRAGAGGGRWGQRGRGRGPQHRDTSSTWGTACCPSRTRESWPRWWTSSTRRRRRRRERRRRRPADGTRHARGRAGDRAVLHAYPAGAAAHGRAAGRAGGPLPRHRRGVAAGRAHGGAGRGGAGRAGGAPARPLHGLVRRQAHRPAHRGGGGRAGGGRRRIGSSAWC